MLIHIFPQCSKGLSFFCCKAYNKLLFFKYYPTSHTTRFNYSGRSLEHPQMFQLEHVQKRLEYTVNI